MTTINETSEMKYCEKYGTMLITGIYISLVGEYLKVCLAIETLKYHCTQLLIMVSKTTLEVWTSTRDRIKNFGNMGEHYDDVLNKLMDACEPSAEFRQNVEDSR